MSTPDWFTAIAMDQPRRLGGLLRRGLHPSTMHDGLGLAQWAVAWNSPRCLDRLARAPGGWGVPLEDLARQLWAQMPAPHRPAPLRGIRHTSLPILDMLLRAGVNLHAPLSAEVSLPLNVALLKEHTVHWVPSLARHHQLPKIEWRARAYQSSPAIFEAVIQALNPSPQALNEAVSALLCSPRMLPYRDELLAQAVKAGGRWPPEQDASALPLSTHEEPAIVLRWLPHVDFPDGPSRNHWLRIMADQPEEVWQAWAKDRPWIQPQENEEQAIWLTQVSPLALRRLIAQGFCPSRRWSTRASDKLEPYGSPPSLSMWERLPLLNRHWDTLMDSDLGLIPPWRADRPESLTETLSRALWMWRVGARWSSSQPSGLKTLVDHLLNQAGSSFAREALGVAAINHLLSEDLRLLRQDPASLSPSKAIHKTLAWASDQWPSFWAYCESPASPALCQRALPLLLATDGHDLLASPTFQSAFVANSPDALTELLSLTPVWRHTFPDRAPPSHTTIACQVAARSRPQGKPDLLNFPAAYWSEAQISQVRAQLRQAAVSSALPVVMTRSRFRP